MGDGGIAFRPVAQLERHDDPQRFVDLRRGETDAVGIGHGRQHVVDQPLDRRVLDIRHGLGPGQQRGVAEQGDLA